MAQYKVVVFDLDGTVLDTLEDLRVAINYAMTKHGHPSAYSKEMARLFFGSAVTVAIQRALAAEKGASEAEILSIGESVQSDADPAEVDTILATYRPYYNSHCDVYTRPYEGIPELLAALRAAGLKTAVVSNKPDAAVQKLVEDMFTGLFDFSLGQIEGVPRKPDKAMTLRCLETLNVTPEEAVYIGDSEIDLLTAKNAGLDVIAVSWGFRGRTFLEQRGARRIADTAEELKTMLLEK